MNSITVAVLVLGLAGALAGVMLYAAARIFAVRRDPRVEEFERALPGVNCGACGSPSCFTYARRIVEEGAPSNLCVVDRRSADTIERALGRAADGVASRVAAIQCCGGSESRKKCAYTGIASCRLAALFDGGDNRCRYSCIGFGDCVTVCPFQALTRNGRSAPAVDRLRCTGCGACVRECPQRLIVLVPATARVHIACSSRDTGKAVRELCDIGCISCGICVKVCPERAITMTDNRPQIDYARCTGCGACIERCPRSIIRDLPAGMPPQKGVR